MPMSWYRIENPLMTGSLEKTSKEFPQKAALHTLEKPPNNVLSIFDQIGVVSELTIGFKIVISAFGSQS